MGMLRWAVRVVAAAILIFRQSRCFRLRERLQHGSGNLRRRLRGVPPCQRGLDFGAFFPVFNQA